MRFIALPVLLLFACGGASEAPDGPSAPADAPAGHDGASKDAPGADAPVADAAVPDAAVPDAAVPDAAAPDAAAPDAAAPDAPGPDAPPPWSDEQHVHIYIDNFCNVSTSPTSFTVPPGETLQLTWHNHSVDYNADVWLSYGGGYLDLETGGTWADPFQFCAGPSSYTAAADVSIRGGPSDACPGFRVYIYCQ